MKQELQMPFRADAGKGRPFAAGTREKATAWLLSQQHPSGGWMQPLTVSGPVPSSSITALALLGLREADDESSVRRAVDQGAAWLAARQRDDGSFGDGTDGRYYREYATGLVAWALAAIDRERYQGEIARAVAYVKQNQRETGLHFGGVGYGMLLSLPTPTNPDGELVRYFAAISPTSFAADGLSAAGVALDDPFWRRIIDYVRSLQNDEEINTRSDIATFLRVNGYRLAGDGGMVPNMENFSRPADELEQLRGPAQPIISQGISTFQGIRVYLRAGLPPGSREIVRALDWVRHHYTVTEHVGFAQVVKAGQRRTWRSEHTGLANELDDETSARLAAEPSNEEIGMTGLYLYLWSMAQALHDLGVGSLHTADGRDHDWRSEIAVQLEALQGPDGSWANRNPRWLEFSALVCTTFALNTLNVLARRG